MTSDAGSPFLLRTSSDLAHTGAERWQQSGAVRRGELHRVRHGVYTGAEGWKSSSARQRFVARARAAALSRPTGVVFSHVTAAVLLGLPLVGPLPPRLDILLVGAGGGRSERDIASHRSPDIPEITSLGDVAVTNLERTLVDVAASSSLVRSLPMIDHALRLGLTDAGRLHSHARSRSPMRARSRVARAIDLGDGRADNPGESVSRARILDAGFEAPDLQRAFPLPENRSAIVDFYWSSIDLIGEFDGLLKYSRADGAADTQTLWREKRREDHLRADHHRIVRWSWDDAWAGAPLERLLARAGVPRA